ncbi:MAG: hypothetical protein ABWX70_05625 [Hyphomicrobium sp.]
MLRFFSTLARIVFGLVLASLAAGLVTVLFVDLDILSGPFDRLPKTVGETIDLALLAATHIAIFSSLFVVIVGALGEWLSIRALTYYLIAGVAIAFLGFSAQYASEIAGQATIFNNYAIKAFLTVGFFGGFVYWLAAGQFAGRARPTPIDAPTPNLAVARPEDREEGATEVVISHAPTIDERPRWRTPVLERLKFSKRSSALPVFPNEPTDLDRTTRPGD